MTVDILGLTFTLLSVVLFGVAAALTVAVVLRCTLFSRLQVRRMRWRTIARIRPGPGFATLPEMWWRWGRIAALRASYRTRPSLPITARVVLPSAQLAAQLGRGPYFRRCVVSDEHQQLIIAPPREGKTAYLGDRVINWAGACLVHETRPDLVFGTAGYRYLHGPVELFNPEGTAGLPSTFRWAMTSDCSDPAEALYRASDLVGAVSGIGEMQWWAEKAQGALAAAVHAAGLAYDDPETLAAAAVAAGIHSASLVGGDMGDVWTWAYGGGDSLITEAKRHPDASEPLFGALAELNRQGKTADSIRITMTKSLQWLSVPRLRDMVTGPGAKPFDVPAWVDSCGTIYMLSPGGEQAPAAPLFRCFTSYARRAAIAHAAFQPKRRLDPGVLFALDEIDKCPVNAPGWLADSGGSGVQVSIVVHSPGQLEDKYGRAGLKTVWSTCGVKVFLPGNHDTELLQQVSVLGGTLPGGEARGLNPILPVEYLSRLPDMRALVINRNLSPLVVKVHPYWKRDRAPWKHAPAFPPLTSVTAPATAEHNGHGGEVHDTEPWPTLPPEPAEPVGAP